MDRRSFVLSLFSGLAAAGLGGVAAAQAAPTKPRPAPGAAHELDAATKAALDRTDAEFSQVASVNARWCADPGPSTAARSSYANAWSCGAHGHTIAAPSSCDAG